MKEHKKRSFEKVSTNKDIIDLYMEDYTMTQSNAVLYCELYEHIYNVDEVGDMELTFPQIIQTINVLKATFVKKMLDMNTKHSEDEMKKEMR